MASCEGKAIGNQKQRIGVAHPRLGRGGSEGAAMWAIEALKSEYDVSVITAADVDLPGLNEFYGTDVKARDISIRLLSLPYFFRSLRVADAFFGCLYQRHCQVIAHDFNVLISAYNLCDFGVPAIHCIADFSWDEEIRRSLDPVPKGTRGLFHKVPLLRKCYLGVARLIARPSGRNLFSGEDMILANSHWSERVIREKFGADVDVVYPPVWSDFPEVPLDSREMGFVCIGRISPEKRIERIVEILSGVRALGHDVHLHVIGDTTGSVYGRYVERMCRDQGDWIRMEGRRFGDEKVSLLSRHRYGIQARQAEPFGISVAEMVKAGCITFVPREGGQAEIVNHEALMYDSVDDAVQKIDAVLRKDELQAELIAHLKGQGERFSTGAFMEGLRDAVERFLNRKGRSIRGRS